MSEFSGYCRNCTDAQLRNVLADEASRYNRHNEQGEVATTALRFYYAAREEMARRGFDADGELRDRGIAAPDV
jgi:hypothetical protein